MVKIEYFHYIAITVHICSSHIVNNTHVQRYKFSILSPALCAFSAELLYRMYV